MMGFFPRLVASSGLVFFAAVSGHCQIVIVPCLSYDPACNPWAGQLLFTVPSAQATVPVLVAVGTNGLAFYSKDKGQTWQSTGSTGVATTLNEVAIGLDGTFTAVGDTGTILSGWNPATNAWQNQSIGGANLTGLAIGRGADGQTYRIATRPTEVWFSTDGQSWNVNSALSAFTALNKAEFALDQFLLVGVNGSASSVATSTPASAWNAANPLPTGVGNYERMVTFNGRAIAVESIQNATVGAYSSDGVNWTDIGNGGGGGQNRLFGVACSTTLCVAVGGAGGAEGATSTDGINWNSFMITGPSLMADIVFLDGQFIAVGSLGNAYISADGTDGSWQTITVDPGSSNLKAVALGYVSP